MPPKAGVPAPVRHVAQVPVEGARGGGKGGEALEILGPGGVLPVPVEPADRTVAVAAQAPVLVVEEPGAEIGGGEIEKLAAAVEGAAPGGGEVAQPGLRGGRRR